GPRSRGARHTGHVPVHARHPPHRISRTAVDDAAVRRIRQRARHQRTLQVPARARTDRTLRRVRLPDAHGLRLRPSAVGGEVGKCGVAISSVADMQTLFDGIPLDQVSVSMTINGPAIILYCFLIAAAERQGVPSEKLRGSIQNDILKEYMAQHAWIYPIEPALRLI